MGKKYPPAKRLKGAELEVLNHIRQYPSLYPCSDSVLNHILLGNGTGDVWKNGRIVNEIDGRKFPNALSYRDAYFQYIGEDFFTYCYYVKWAPLWNIPEDVAPDWLELCKHFCYTILKRKVSHYASMVKGNLLMRYGDGFYKHPDNMIRSDYERRVQDFKEIKSKAKELAKSRGWYWMYRPKTKKQKEHTDKIVNELIDKVLKKSRKK